MAVLLKGKIELRVDPAGMEAVLEFTADKKGQSWSREKIIKLLKEESIIESINPQTLERACEHFAQLESGTNSVIIARGVPPVDATAGGLHWENLSIPDPLTEAVNEIVRQAPPPLVYDRKIKKPAGKKEKRLKKKKGYITGKQNMEEIKTRVSVSPDIQKIGYVEKGGLIASLLAPQPGKPGKNIFGQEVPPPAPVKARLYYGDNILLKDNKLYAGVNGIVRCGSDWIDIIPHGAAYYRVYASEDTLECRLDFSPGSAAVEKEYGARINQEARALGFGENELLIPSQIDGVLEQARHYKRILKGFSLCTDIEPLIQLAVTADKLKATLTLQKGRGQGKQLQLNEIGRVIKEAQLKNMNLPQIKHDILEFIKGRQRDFLDYELAAGIPPGKGENGELVWEISFAGAEDFKAYKALHGNDKDPLSMFPSTAEFPFSLVTRIARAKKDEKIAVLRPPGKGRPGLDVYGQKIDGLAGAEVKFQAYENIKQYGQYFLAGGDGILETGNRNGTIQLRLKPSKDAQALIAVSEDKTSAFLTILPPKGIGKTITLPELTALIAGQGIVTGINPQALPKAVATAAKRVLVENVLFASGRAAVNGVGERWNLKISKASGKKVHILADGRADYKYQDKITVVKKGDLVAEILPPSGECSDGMDVLGKTIPAKRIGAAPVTTGKNVKKELQPDGIIAVTALVDGEFKNENNFLDVKELYLLDKNVGLETGNVKFPGSVMITGSVLSGFVVISGADITIENLVEDALVSAEGSILVKKGVKGSGKAILRAKKNIQCLFAENALLLAKGNIFVKNFLLHCDVKCNSRLILGQEKGTIMGGNVRAKNGLELINLGSVSEIKTRVSFGQDYLIADQIELQEKELKKLGDRALSLDAMMKNQEKLSAPDQAKLQNLREEKLQTLKLMEAGSKRLFVLREKFEEHYPGEVIVKGSIYPGVIVESHGRRYEVKEEKSMVAFVFNPKMGRIELKPLA